MWASDGLPRGHRQFLSATERRFWSVPSTVPVETGIRSGNPGRTIVATFQQNVRDGSDDGNRREFALRAGIALGTQVAADCAPFVLEPPRNNGQHRLDWSSESAAIVIAAACMTRLDDGVALVAFQFCRRQPPPVHYPESGAPAAVTCRDERDPLAIRTESRFQPCAPDAGTS